MARFLGHHRNARGAISSSKWYAAWRTLFLSLLRWAGAFAASDMRAILLAGADKVSINSAAVHGPELIEQAARLRQPVHRRCDRRTPVAAQIWQSGSGWDVYVSGGRINTGLDAVEWAREAERRGAGELLLTSMDGDGTQAGYDIALTRTISDAVGVPVIASGGAGRPEHFVEALTDGGAAAALAASLFHFRQLSIMEVKAHLRAAGVPVRIPPADLL